jgi:S1-C subfamily serine protease
VTFWSSVRSADYTGNYEGLLGTNSKVLPCNSGGPKATEDGRVVGVVAIKVSVGNDHGLGLAIPIEIALQEFPLIAP